jgi:hypothetical protein
MLEETTKELEKLSHEVNTTASPERLQVNAQTISDPVASGLSASALRQGDVAPDFALPDTHGHVLALKTLLDRGPVVVSFCRGGWCPFCNLELRGLPTALVHANKAIGRDLVEINGENGAAQLPMPGHLFSTKAALFVSPLSKKTGANNWTKILS